MVIVDIFDAARDGTYKEFLSFYSGKVNLTDKHTGLNLLCQVLCNDKNSDDKLKIIEFLISEGIDINFKDKKMDRNALHTFYFGVWRPNPDYMFEVTKLLVENGIDINAKDKYNAIPLKYAVTLTKHPTEMIRSTYEYLLIQGSDYKNKDVFDKSCIDYSNEYSWRNDVIKIIEEIEDGS